MSSAKSFLRRRSGLLAVAVSCMALGAGASVIATAGAASSSAPSAKPAAAHPRAARLLARWRAYGGAVQGELVVNTKAGWKTVSFERGFVQSVSGDTLTLREATRTATYRTVTLTIPAGARVRNQGRASSLAQLSPGEHVLVIQAPAHTSVVARAATS